MFKSKISGQLYILSLVVLTGVFVSGIFIQGLALNQLRITLDMKRSMTAIFTADAGSEEMFYYIFNNGPRPSCLYSTGQKITNTCSFVWPQNNQTIGNYWIFQSCDIFAGQAGCGTTNTYYFDTFGQEAQNGILRIIESKPK